MTRESLKSDLPIIATTIITAVTAVASLTVDKNLALAVTAVGSIVAAFISYMKARGADANARRVASIAADALTNANAKTVFVESVTAERAVWRKEMREVATALVAAMRWSANRHRIDWEKVYLLCSEIRLRLNPAGRELPRPSEDKHPLDRTIHALLDEIVDSSSKDRTYHRGYADSLEAAMAKLLKQEWDKSKQEAVDGHIGRPNALHRSSSE